METESELTGIVKKKGKKISDSTFEENFKDYNFSHWIFENIGAVKIKFENCDFSYCRFYDGYFNQCIFENCNFTGVKFISSNLYNSRFTNCDFKYSSFVETKISHQEILRNLPGWTNARRTLLHNLRKNAEKIGDKKAVNAFLKFEIETTKEHLKKAFKGEESYYDSKYKGFFIKLNILFERLLTSLDWYLWGHGEYPIRIVLNAFLVILFSSFYIFFSETNFCVSTGVGYLNSLKNHLSWTTELFLGVGKAKKDYYTCITYFIVLSRYVSVGLFISTLVHRLRWR